MARKGHLFFRNAQSLLVAVGAILSVSDWLATAFGDRAVSQITPDGTLGRERSVVTPNVEINGILGDRIDGGATRGANLFHSFSQFNIGEGGRVYFANPSGIENIFSRVTGNTASQILGTLGVTSNANLYFLNPNGIIFGRNAKLDIRGSFIATTAERFVFNNGTQFSATNPQAPLLTMSVPVGLQYGTGRGTINNQGNLAAGQDLILSATNLTLAGQLYAGRDLKLQAQDTVQIRDSITNPFIAYAGNDLDIQGNQSIDIFALNHPNSGFYSGRDMVFRSTNPVGGDAHYFSNGNFRLENLDGTLGNLYSPYDPIILTAGNVSLGDYTGASLHILAGGSVTLGDVRITGTDAIGNTINPGNNTLFNGIRTIGSLANVTLSNGTTIAVNGSTQSTLDVRAGVDWTRLGGVPTPDPRVVGSLAGFTIPPNYTSPPISANISIGDININANGSNGGRVLITNNYKPNASLIRTSSDITINGVINTRDVYGNGAIITDSRNKVTINGSIQASCNLLNCFPIPISPFTYEGNGGDVSLLARGDINLNGEIFADGLLGGNVTLESDRSIFLNNTINSRSYSPTSGLQGGTINITANEQVITPAINITSQIITDSLAAANAGDINISASQVTLQNNSQLYTQSQGTGNAGNIRIRAAQVLIQDSTELSTRTHGTGNAGNIRIASEQVTIQNSELSTSMFGTGDAGNIRITAEQVFLQDSAALSARTFNSGAAGDISITASDLITIQNSAELYTNTDFVAVGNAGNITLNSPSIDLNRAFLFANSNSSSDAGKINIETNQFTAQNGSFLNASSQGGGTGGDVSINAPNGIVNFIGNDGARISPTNNLNSTTVYLAAVGNGNAGNLTINTGQFIVQNGALIYGSTSNPNTDFGSGGNAANINVNATESVQILGTTPDGSFPSSLATDTFGTGNAGILTIDTPTLIVRDGGRVSAGTVGTGQAGTLRVNANFVEVDGTSRNGFVPSRLILDSDGAGNAGEFSIDTRYLIVRNGGEVTAKTAATGQGGILNVRNAELVQVTGTSASGIPSRLIFDSTGSGNAGELRIDTQRLLIQDGGEVRARASGSGRGGIIDVNASNSVQINGTGSGLFFDSSGTGDARGINITTGQLEVLNGGQVTVSGTGMGRAGDIDISASSIFINNSARMTATTVSGEGGNINLQVDNSIILRHDSDIRTEALGTGDGGNININAGGFILAVLSENSDVIAGAVQGNGGKITATAQGIFGFRLYQDTDTPESDFTASSELGIDGTVVLNTLDKPQPDTLPNDFQGGSLDNRCQAGSNPQGRSSFVVKGDGGLPTNPDYGMSNDIVEVGLVSPVPSSGSRGEIPIIEVNPANPPRQAIEEAQGWVVDETGKVTLVGSTSTPIPQRPSLPTASCQFTQQP